MAVLGRDWVTLSTITDVQYVRKYYLLQPSSSGAPQPPTVNPPPSNSGWSLTEPSYTEGSTNSLYETMLIIFSNGEFDYLPVQKSSSYEAAKVAYNKSVAAANAATAADLAAAAAQAAADKARQEAVSRGTDLVTNGTGMLGDNTNFSSLDFDPTDAPVGSAGSFVTTKKGVSSALFNDELIPVDPGKRYILSAWVRETGDPATPGRFYIGTVPYAADKSSISPQHYYYLPDTETTLAQPLANGSTTAVLTDGSDAGWALTSNVYLGIWNWTDGLGKLWPLGTFTKNVPRFESVSGNTVTLAAPWNGATVPAGTKVTVNRSGGSYMYNGASNKFAPEEWERFSSPTPIGGLHDGTTGSAQYEFPAGTAFVKLVFLANRESATSQQAFAGVSLSDASAAQAAADAQSAKITTFYGSATPVGPKEGDLWFKDDKSLHRRVGTNWVVVTDAGLAAAVDQITVVQTIADGKIRTYAQDNPPTGLLAKDEGDIWLDTNDGNRMYRWNGATPGAWVPVRDHLIEAHEAALAEIEAEMLLAAGVADGTATVLVQSNTPTVAQRTPTTLWVNTGDGGRPYRWNGTAWVRLANDGAVEAARKAVEALGLIDVIESELQDVKDDLDAAEAQQLLFQANLDAQQGTMTTLNKKVTVSYNPPPSTIAGYSAGDVWEQHDGTTSLGRWVVSGSMWTPFKAGVNFLGENSVGSAQIIDLSVGTAQIANASITDAKIGDLNVGKLTVTGPADFTSSFTQNLIANNGFIENLAATRVVVGASPNLIAHGKLKATGDRTTGKWTPNRLGSGLGFTAWSASWGMGLTTASSPATVGNVFTLEKGQTYKFSARVRGGSSSVVYGVAAHRVVVAPDGSITSVSIAGHFLSDESATTSVTDVEGTWECTTTATYMLQFTTSNSTLYINDIRLSSLFSGVLIENGTVTADHIKLDTLTGKTVTGLNIQTSTHATTGIKITGNTFRAYGSGSEPLININGSTGTITGAIVQTSSLSNRGIKIESNNLVAYDNTSSTIPKFTLSGTTGEVTSVGGTFTGAKVNGGQITVGAVSSYPRIDMKDDLWLDFIGMRFHSNNASTGAEVKSNTAAYDDYGVGGLFMTSAKTTAGFGTELRLGTAKTELFINENGAFGSRLLMESTAVSMERAGNLVFNATSAGTALLSGSSSLSVDSSRFYVSVGSSTTREFEATTSTINIRRAGNEVFTASTSGTAVKFGTSEMMLSNAFNVSNVSSFNLNTSTDARIQAWTSGGITYYSAGHTFTLVGLNSNTANWSMTPTTSNNAVRNVLRYNGGRTYMPSTTLAANLHMDGNGRIFATTSSRESKVDIRDLQDPLRVLNVSVRDWYDRDEVEGYASFLDGNEDEEVVPTPFSRVPGVVAEEVEEAGLSEFVTYGLDGKPDGVLYDRLALLLIPVVRDLKAEVMELREQLTDGESGE